MAQQLYLTIKNKAIFLNRIHSLNNHRVISLLLYIVFISTFFVLVFPLWPRLTFSLSKPNPNKVGYNIPISYPIEKGDLPIPDENRLVIPKLGIDSEILESNSLDILLSKEGVWREPFMQTPDQKGNMVIAGHRFQYLPPNTNTFYNLDQLKSDDLIIVLWNKKAYIYKVFKTFTVDPTETWIRNTTQGIEHEITLYTCTPLYTSTKRLVVQAKQLI